MNKKTTQLSKSRIISHQQCPKRLWLEVNRKDLIPPVDANTQSRFDAGNLVGDIARQAYPDGVLIDVTDLSKAITDTAAVIDGPPRPVFEATFSVDGVLVSVDLLLPTDGGYRLVEVKSSTSVKPYHVQDASIQAWVLKQAGVPLTEVEVAHIDTGFCYEGNNDYRGLLKHVAVTEETNANQDSVPIWVQEAKVTLAGDMPETPVGSQCQKPFACPFQDFCSPQESEIGFPLDILPRSGTEVKALISQGYKDLRDLPDGALSNSKHERMRQACITGNEFIAPEAGKIIQSLAYPRYYLDFESIQMVVPIWPYTHPYEQTVFQWSCHIEEADGTLTHRKFLATGEGDPRRAFSETLVEVLGSEGQIIVFNETFERERMKEMAALFPDLAPAMNAAITRLFDLLPIAREHYYHPGMRGSWSIKDVLCSIAPERAHSNLAVSDGTMAMDAFKKIIDHATDSTTRDRLRASLLEYCKLDTEAMVIIARHFAGEI